MGERYCVRQRHPSLVRALASTAIGPLLCGVSVWGWVAGASAQYLYNPPVPTAVGAPAGTEIPPPWYVVPSFGLGETWTDNVNLAPPGQEQTELITSLSPGLSINGQTPRSQVAVNFNPQILIFDLGTSSPVFQPNSLGTSHTELVEDTLFFDGSFSLSQQYLNSAGAIAQTTLTTSNNLQTTAALNATPYLLHHFGDYVDSRTQYRFTYAATTGNAAINGTPVAPQLYNEISQIFTNGDYFSPLGWTLTGDYNRTNGLSSVSGVSGGTVSSDLYFTLQGIYPIYERLSATAMVGYENIANSTLATSQPAGPIWSLGFQYNPSPYAAVSFSGGQRYGGTNFNFNATYNPSPDTHFDAFYTEQISTTQLLLANNVNTLAVGPNGTIISPQTGLPVIPGSAFGTGTVNLGLTTGSYLDKHFELDASATRERNTYTVSAYLDSQSQQTQASNTRSLGATASWTRQLWPDLTSNVSGSYAQVSFVTGPSRVDNYYFINAALTYNLSSSANAQLSFVRTDRQSSQAINDLIDDQVTISVTKRF